jgi:anti-sigma B factor antagonist
MSSSADGPGSPPNLDVHDAVAGDVQTIRMVGELDLATAPKLEAVLSRLDGAKAVTLDLSGLTFMDSCGLRSVLRVKQMCEQRGYDFRLVPGEQQVQRLFELTGLLDVLPFQKIAA